MAVSLLIVLVAIGFAYEMGREDGAGGRNSGLMGYAEAQASSSPEWENFSPTVRFRVAHQQLRKRGALRGLFEPWVRPG